MSYLNLPQTSPHVSLKQCSQCLPIHYLSLSFNWKWAKSLCFLCMQATDLQGNRWRRLQCTTSYVITALIKTITAAHSFHSYGVVCLATSPSLPIWMYIFPTIPCEASQFPQYVCKWIQQCLCVWVCTVCVYEHLLQVNHRVLRCTDSMK